MKREILPFSWAPAATSLAVFAAASTFSDTCSCTSAAKHLKRRILWKLRETSYLSLGRQRPRHQLHLLLAQLFPMLCLVIHQLNI